LAVFAADLDAVERKTLLHIGLPAGSTGIVSLVVTFCSESSCPVAWLALFGSRYLAGSDFSEHWHSLPKNNPTTMATMTQAPINTRTRAGRCIVPLYKK
jgi:hypothetical protein